uniref:Reverse transcriptase Ty1/copia-type domain-containing protein n=1 Tax=Fagus sylvatica TaxID=28930 RepID=A0A2N9F1H5_FAGSY
MNLFVRRLVYRPYKLNVLTTTPLAPLQQSDSDQSSPNTRRSDRKSNKFCRYCKKHGHTIETCYCRNRSTAAVTHGDTNQTPTAAIAPAHSGSTITLTTDQLEDIIAQALVRAGNASSSSTLSVLPGKFSSWLLDSACCNHMTPYPSFFSHTSFVGHAPTIHTANGSIMLVRSIGIVSTSKLSISDVFHMPKLSYNLLSVGQLAELSYRIILDYFGCIVQDPRTGQELRTDRKIGRLFEISNLHLPATGVSAATSSSPSLSLWHSQLGHASSSQFLYPFREKLFLLLPMSSIVLQAQPFLIRLLMSAFLDLHFTINISDPLALPVSSFFNLMNTTNSSLVLAFVASLVMAKLKKDIDVMILLLIAFASPTMLSFGSIVCSLRHLNFVPPSPSPLSQIFFQRCLLLLQSCFLLLRMYLPPFHRLTPAPSEDSAPITTLRRSSRATMTEELDALSRNRTWDLVDLPPDKSMVSCKCVFKIKTRSDGSIERYKARLVAKGFTQEYGIDYEETFAPVARLSSVRTLLAVVASRQWKLFQMNVKNAFLNGDLSEEVYMQPPPGLSHPPDKLYSFSTRLFHNGIQELKDFLSQNFEMKDLGHLNYFLGLEITYSDDGFYLTQAKYTSDLLSRVGLTDHKIVDTPIKLNARLAPSSGELLPDPTLYRQLVGSLVYLTVTRPDISYAVHQVSQFMSSLRSTHYAAVLRILRYLKGTLFHGLHFSAQSPLTLRAYSDADWAGDLIDRRSTTSYCFLLGSSLISWRSKKQSVVARSSTKAEYRALVDTTSELLWLRWLLQDLGVSTSSATPIYCDNRSAIQIARNDVFHERTKHIEIDCHLVWHHLLQGSLQLIYVSSHDQLADIFTKSHPT